MSARGKLIGLALSASLCLLANVAASDNTFEDKLLPEPFKSSKAQARLKQELKLSDATIEQMKQIVEYGYSFKVIDQCPYSRPSDCTTTHYVEVRRIVRFSLDSVVEWMVDKIRASEQHGCSTLVFPGSGLTAVQQFKIYFSGGIKARKNFCDDILGDHNVGEARGTWHMSIPAIVNPAPMIITNPENLEIDTGSMKFGTPQYSSNIDSASLFGFIDLDGWFGSLLSDILINFDLSPIKFILKIFGESTPEEAMSDMMRQFERVSELLRDFTFESSRPTEEYLEVIKTQDPAIRYPFFIDGRYSGFSQTDNPLAKLQWNVVQTAYYRYRPGEQNDLFSFYYGFMLRQLALVESWDDDDRQHVVAEGETMWKIAGAELGNPRLHLILSTYNERFLAEPDMLHPGDVVTIPPLWKVFALNNHNKMIRDGDTFWDRYVTENTGESWQDWLAAAKSHARNPNAIYPGQIFLTLGSGSLPN